MEATNFVHIRVHENFYLLILWAAVAVCLFRVLVIGSLSNMTAGTLRTVE